jgi:hypothetical protein
MPFPMSPIASPIPSVPCSLPTPIIPATIPTRPRPRPLYSRSVVSPSDQVARLAAPPPAVHSEISNAHVTAIPFADMVTWQINVRLKCPTPDIISISASTPTVAAQTVIDSTRMYSPYSQPGQVYSFMVAPGVSAYRQVTPHAWLNMGRQIRLCVIIEKHLPSLTLHFIPVETLLPSRMGLVMDPFELSCELSLSRSQ